LSNLPKKKLLIKNEEMKQKNRDRVRKYRQEQKIRKTTCPAKSVERKMSERQKETKTAAAKNQITPSKHSNDADGAYSTKGAVRKAISRANSSLPKSIKQRKVVVKVIYDKLFAVPKPRIPRYTGTTDASRQHIFLMSIIVDDPALNPNSCFRFEI
jgi:hypothetical protein